MLTRKKKKVCSRKAFSNISKFQIIFTILTPQLESKDAATATARLRDIFKLDSQLASQLDTFSLQLADLQKQIDQVRNDGQLKPLSQILEIDDENSEENFKHPTDQVVIIKRFNDKWKSIRAALDFKKVAESLHYLDDEFSTRREDMHEAMAGIIRLGETYHIPARNFSEGVIKQFHSRLKFDQPQDLFEMGESIFYHSTQVRTGYSVIVQEPKETILPFLIIFVDLAGAFRLNLGSFV